jgi:hypothetical protein
VVLSDAEKLLLAQEVNLQSFSEYKREQLHDMADDFVLAEVSVELVQVNVCFQTAAGETLVALRGKSVCFHSQSFPKSQALRVTVEDFSARDSVVQGTLFPTILSRIHTPPPSSASSSSSPNSTPPSSSSSAAAAHTHAPVDMYSFSPEHASDPGYSADPEPEPGIHIHSCVSVSVSVSVCVDE